MLFVYYTLYIHACLRHGLVKLGVRVYGDPAMFFLRHSTSETFANSVCYVNKPIASQRQLCFVNVCCGVNNEGAINMEHFVMFVVARTLKALGSRIGGGGV